MQLIVGRTLLVRIINKMFMLLSVLIQKVTKEIKTNPQTRELLTQSQLGFAGAYYNLSKKFFILFRLVKSYCTFALYQKELY